MPQATLLGYFKSIQPESTSRSTNAESLTCQRPPIDSFRTVNDSCGPNPSQSTGLTITNVPTIRDLTTPGIFGDSNLDFFVPPNQPQAAVVRALPSHAARLKNITSTLLPVRYPDKFFNECFHDAIVAELTRVLLWNTQPVGWIRCRLEENDHGSKQIYVQALGILAPYRGCGLATHLLEQVTTPALIKKYCPASIYCHVWEQNEDAIGWYERRGFKRFVLLDQYYRRLKPAGAWIMTKDLS